MPSERSTPAVVLWALSALLAAMVFLLVLGSGSEQRLTSVGHSGRWILLGLVWCAAGYLFVLAARRNRTDRVPLYAVVALFLPALGAVSAAWSVAPVLTVERAVSLGVLVSAALFLGFASTVWDEVVEHVGIGLLAGAAAAGLAGVALVFVDRAAAIQAAGEAVPFRYRGLGENPNTFAMLAAVALPLAGWLIVDGGTAWARIAGSLSATVFIGSIAFSASRGAFLAAFIGAGIFVFARPHGHRAVEVPAVAGAFACAFLAALIPQPAGRVTAVPSAPTTRTVTTADGTVVTVPNSSSTVTLPGGVLVPPAQQQPGALPVSVAGYNPSRLQDELGRPFTDLGRDIPHPLFGSSGRVQAWAGAVKQAGARPVLGYGFGNEERVFVDRFYFFQGGRPENSWVGTYLQLGLIGVAAMLSLWLALLPATWSALRRRRTELDAALVGVCVAGLILSLPQSYFFSVGNVATTTVWIAMALLAFSTLRRGAAR